jgi:hypothetical protein
MKASLTAVLILLTAAVSSFAQTPTAAFFKPSSDVYVGYVTTFPDYGATYDTIRLNGAEVAYNQNFRKHLSLTVAGDFVQGGPYSVSQFTGTVGPKVVLLTGKIRPYGTLLAGYSRQNSNGMYASDHHPALPAGKSLTESGLTYRMGGGVDIQLSSKVYWRAIQFDMQPQPWGRHTPDYSNWGSGFGYRF